MGRKLKKPRPSPPSHEFEGIEDEHTGKIFGRKYRIDRLIAKGGMGRVYRATQFPLERPVAIKILNAEFQQSDPQFVKRFFLEASIAAQLSHPHTITVFDYGEGDDGELYIAMEYLKGRPLSRALRKDGPLDSESALQIALQICRALREAHRKGVIHRDLKPGNVFLIDEGSEEGVYAKVLDFGLVKLFRPESDAPSAFGKQNLLGDGDPELTRTGTLLGSPKYMSPEQIKGDALDPRTDIYSFGIILFQLFAGQAPFKGATGVDVIYKHVNTPAPRTRDVNQASECPDEVEAIIQRCLEKDRDLRFADMDELIVALKDAQRLVTGISIAADSVSDANPIGANRHLRSLRPESAFREPLAEDPTPSGLLVADRGDTSHVVSPEPTRMPLYLAALGFVVALLTLIYVVAFLPNRDGDLVDGPPIPAEPAEAAVPPNEVPPLPKALPDAIDPPSKTEVTPVVARPSKDRRITRPKRTKKRPTKTSPKSKSTKTKAEDSAPEVPSNYRDNPY